MHFRSKQTILHYKKNHILPNSDQKITKSDFSFLHLTSQMHKQCGNLIIRKENKLQYTYLLLPLCIQRYRRSNILHMTMTWYSFFLSYLLLSCVNGHHSYFVPQQERKKEKSWETSILWSTLLPMKRFTGVLSI